MIPLSDIAHYAPGLTPLSVNHQGPFVATTFSFSLPEGEPLGTAVDAIQRTMARHGTRARPRFALKVTPGGGECEWGCTRSVSVTVLVPR